MPLCRYGVEHDAPLKTRDFSFSSVVYRHFGEKFTITHTGRLGEATAREPSGARNPGRHDRLQVNSPFTKAQQAPAFRLGGRAVRPRLRLQAKR